MKTTRNYILGISLAVAFLVAANVRADVITSYTDPELYAKAASSHNWLLGNFDGNKDNWTFTATNGTDVVGGTLTSYGQAGNSGFHTIESDVAGTITLRHNTSVFTSLAFSLADIANLTNGFVDSFYFWIDPHDNSSNMQLDVTAKAIVNGVEVTEKLYQTGGGFFGYTLDDGYFTEFIIGVDYGKNNGGYTGLFVGLGDTGLTDPGTPFTPVEPPRGGGDDSNVVPEPATIAILGLGLAGLGVARRRMRR